MSNKTIKYKFRNESFVGYGLNKYRNFLESPVCECGCEESTILLIDSREELFGLMNDLLLSNDCDCCAVFAHSYDGNLYAAIKCESVYEDYEYNTDNETPVKFFGAKDDYLEFFQEWDGAVELHCYGLMIEIKKGQWKIIED